MAHRLSHFLGRNGYLLLLVIFLVGSTGALVFLQYQHYQSMRASRAQAIPLSSQPSNTHVSGVKVQAQSGGSGGMESNIKPMLIRLSEGKAQPQAAAQVQVTTGEPLSQAEIDQLLARLPAVTPQPGDQSDFKLPGDPIPPPRPGQTVDQPFPPAESAPPVSVESGPLQVLRFAPEGEVSIAPFLNVTFNQPMVALSTISDLVASQVPVQIEPSLPGTWRWLGARTLTFQYDSTLIDRLPKATVYHITIPAGTKSATGGVLAETVTWSFTTPPPKVTAFYPTDTEPQSLNPLFFIHFDQRIDPPAVLGHIRVTAGGKDVSLKLTGMEDVEADKRGKDLLQSAVEGRWIAFRAQEPLPADTDINVTVDSGTPSAEGPLTTQSPQSQSFRTYAPLRVTDHGCSWGSGECRPLMPFYINFNNPIDMDAYDPAMVKVVPELPGASINIYGSTMNIQGASKGQTTYTVILSADLKDTFGQTLGQEVRLDFRVGRAEAMLSGPEQNFTTLDPASKKPQFSVYTINYTSLDLKIYAVQPSDWPAFKEYLRNFQRTDVQMQVPGRKVLEKNLPVESVTDELTEVNIDLSPVMDGNFGHFIVIVSPPGDILNQNKDLYWQTVQTWVQVTQIGLDAFTDQSEMVAWATALQNGAPLDGIAITAHPGGAQVATTGGDGTARFPIPDGASYLVASQGADQALLPRSSFFWGDDIWSKQPVYDQLRWYVFDDRQMYRPGEEVHVKGWIRKVGGGQTGDVGLADGVTAVNYHIIDSQGNAIGDGQAQANMLGGFDFVYTIPEKVNLGYTTISLSAQGGAGGSVTDPGCAHIFQIQEFRRPEFEVTARNETPGPYFAGDHAVVAVDAKYYAGGGLPNADVTWQVSSNPGQYAPPNWPEFTFGTWTPWWWGGRGMKGGYISEGPYYGPDGPFGGGKVETFTGKTDAAGTHYLGLDFSKEAEPKPVSVVAQATVMDVNRQAWTGTTTLLVHPANLYVGIRSARYFVELGTPMKIDVIVTDLDGNPVVDRQVEVRAGRMEWKYKNGDWQEEEVDTQTCVVGSQKDPVSCTFATPLGGSYRITATVTDDQGRLNQSQFTRWVSGGKLPPARKVEQEQVTLIPDKETYQPGDVAQILVQSPFSPAEGLMTIDRGGIVSTQRFHIENGTTTLSVPVEEGYTPNLNIQVDVNGSAPRTDDQGQAVPDVPARPAFATGQITLPIPPLQRTLSVEAAPAQGELEPGGETNIDVTVKDAGGQPVADAEVAVVVVDEAILALSNYQMADPIQVFYEQRPIQYQGVYGRSSIVLANPQALSQQNGARVMSTQVVEKNAMARGAAEAPAAAAMPTMAAAESADMAYGAPGGAQPQPIRVRMDFNPLAIFSPAVHTDADGKASVAVKLPDNLTRYRVMVVAVDQNKKFGMGESKLVARLPLMVRPSAPRFLNFGDRFELPVVLQNQTDAPITVDVAVQVTNLELTGSQGTRVTVPARDRLEVRFPAATQLAGTARIQIAASAGDFADAATIDLPVYTPATTEAFATYGVIDEGAAAQPVAPMKDIFPQYGGLEITTSSTALQALTDAVLYMVSYPYDCTEQAASRILAISALRDVLTAFRAEGLPSPQAMEASVSKDLDMLKGLQNDDGGFPYWRRGQESIPFNTIHTAHALVRAQSKGFSVPGDMQQRTLDYLRQIESHYPTWYSAHTRQTLSAYALYVRNLTGDRDPDKAMKLIDEAGLENLSLDAVGWLWPVLKDAPGNEGRLEEIRRLVTNRAVETAGAANFTTRYDDQNYLLLGSNRRTDAILLDALINDNPGHDLIVKVVNGLLAHRTKGRWDNTQENVFVLLALDRYFNTFEAQTPDFVARIWLGDTYAAAHEFHGRTTDRQETNIPMSYLVDSLSAGSKNLILSKEGAGRLYYRLGLRYAPTSLKQDPLDMGFVVQRVYEAVDNPEDVRLDSEGVWHIKAGARVRVHLTLVADNRRYHVALVDPLPAGLEIVNPALAVSGDVPGDPAQPLNRSTWWWGPWYQHQNMRDERAEAFTTLLWDGVYTYSYIARATTPGQFIVPPAKAEEMYSPEVFGRSGSSTVIVE